MLTVQKLVLWYLGYGQRFKGKFGIFFGEFSFLYSYIYTTLVACKQ